MGSFSFSSGELLNCFSRSQAEKHIFQNLQIMCAHYLETQKKIEEAKFTAIAVGCSFPICLGAATLIILFLGLLYQAQITSSSSTAVMTLDRSKARGFCSKSSLDSRKAWFTSLLTQSTFLVSSCWNWNDPTQ